MTERDSGAPLLFASYHHRDLELVRPVVEAIERAGIDVWLDLTELQPGEDWASSIRAALERSDGVLVFLSPAYVTSSSTLEELNAVTARGGLIIPLAVTEMSFSDLPMAIRRLQIVDLRQGGTDSLRVADDIAAIAWREHREPSVPSGDAEGSAQVMAASRRARPSDADGPPTSVFLVHGHDDAFLGAVEEHVASIGVRSVVLKRTGGSSQSLLQKFLEFGAEARFAIVLLTGDDLGAARRQYEMKGVRERSLQFRARQNVVLELGYFYGLLGWENVFVLRKPADKAFPNFELPSDLGGTVYDKFDESGAWRDQLRTRLTAAGFAVAQRSTASVPALDQ